MVNVSLVLEKYDKLPDVERAMEAKHKAQKDELQQRGNELGKRNKELDEMFNQAQPEEAVFEKVQKLRRDTYYYERDLNRLNAEIQKEYTKRMREVLSDVRVAIRSMAEKGGFDLVLRSPYTDEPEAVAAAPGKAAGAETPDKPNQPSPLEPRTTGQVIERFRRNPVLFGAKAVDITEEVLKKLNADYAKRTGTAKK